MINHSIKKEHYEALRSMSSEAEIWAYAEKYWDEIFPEVPRDQWDVYCEVKEKVEARAEEDLRKRWNIEANNWPLGSCHMIWARMKEIFKEEYNIDWKAPAECEPDVYFD